MLRFISPEKYIDPVYRNSKKQILKKLKDQREEIIFGENYIDDLGLRNREFRTNIHEILDGIIDKMTEEECETNLDKIFKATQLKRFESISKRDLEMLEGEIPEIKKEWPTRDQLRIIRRSSEVLWSIFEKMKEKKELQVEQFRKKYLKQYEEKSDELAQKIENQKKAEKLAKIREKEKELERLKKGL